jgi:primary-amine oxidase
MHPLDPLTSSEITAAASLVQNYEAGKNVHFKNIELIEPSKGELRPFLRRERHQVSNSTPPPRRVSLLYYHRGTANLFRAVINLSVREIEDVQPLDSRFHGQADMDEVVEVRDRCLSHPKVLERIKRYGLPAHMTVVCDTWPYGRDSSERIRRLSQVCQILL